MVNHKEWMREISDDASLASLSLPGTHNSAACHTALPSVQCQDASVSEQLVHGVRFLDIRVSKNVLKSEEEDQKRLIVIHGKFPVRLLGNVYLSDVLADVYKFIGEHPSECVVVSIKQEGNGSWDNDADEFGNLIWDKYVQPEQRRWYLGTDIPQLRQCRGKAVLFRRFGVKDEQRNNEFGVNASWWTYNCAHDDRGPLQIQDFCEISSSEDIAKKAEYVKQLSRAAVEFNSTQTQPQEAKLFVNFCSGSNFFDRDCWPENVAKALVAAGIEQSFGRGSGVVVLDYADADNWRLVHELVERNF